MRHRAVRLGTDGVHQLRGLAAFDGLSVSQALRKAAILGCGGTVADADAANAYMANRAVMLESALGELPGRHGAGEEPADAVVSCRLPQPWNQRLSARGAFAQAVRAGLELWSSGRAR